MPFSFNPITGSLDLVNAASLGDVVGPAGATDNALARFDLATGKLIQNSGIIVDDSNNVTGINELNTVSKVEVGDPGSETAGINILGITWATKLRVNDIGGTQPAQLTMHRHSTTWPTSIIGARSNSDTSSHVDITNNMDLMHMVGAGWAGSNYKIFGLISMSSDSTGTISNTSAPGKMTFFTTPNGSVVWTEAMNINSSQVATFANTIVGSISGNAATVTTNANLTGVVTSIGNATAIANGAISNAMLANGAVANLSGTNSGDNAVNSLYSGLVSNANHTGDATGATALTLATVNANVGSFGSASAVSTFTVNAKGLITAAASTPIAIAAGAVSGLATVATSGSHLDLSNIGSNSHSAIDTHIADSTIHTPFTITSALDGQTLRYNSSTSRWINNSIIRNTGTVEINPTAVASNQPYSFLVDHAATNLVNNPSFENNITDFWSSTGTPTLTRDTTQAWIGTACLKIVSSAVNSGVISASIPVSINTNYVFSFYVKGNVGGESVYATVTGNSSGAVSSIGAFFPTLGVQNAVNTMWTRYTFGMTTNGTDTSVTLQIRSELAAAQTIFIDAVQFEAKSLPTDANEVVIASSYLDGSMGVGYAFNGTVHNSTSSRTAGAKFLAPLNTTANRGNLVIRTDGSIARLFADAEEIQHGSVSGYRNEPNFPFTFLGDIKTNVQTSGILAGVMNVRNTANGTALHVQSQATTSEGMVISADAITSGSCFAVFAPSDLSAMQAAGGKFFSFAGKAANSIMYEWRVDSVSMGALAFQFQKNINILGGGSQNSTSRAIGTTVSVTNASATVTGSNFLTDFKRGQHIQINNGGANTLSYTIFSIESNSSLTLSSTWTGTTNAARAVTSRVLQYSPPMISLEGSYANHGNTLNTPDFMYGIYASGGGGQLHVMRSAARGVAVTPTADHTGNGIVTARQVLTNSGLIFGVNTETTMISGYTINAYELTPGGAFRISFIGAFIADNILRTLTWRVKLGGTTILTSTAVQAGVVGTINFRGVIEIFAPTTTTQIVSLSIVGKDGASLLPGLTYSVDNITTTGTVDLRIDQALTVTAQADLAGQVISISGVTTEIL